MLRRVENIKVTHQAGFFTGRRLASIKEGLGGLSLDLVEAVGVGTDTITIPVAHAAWANPVEPVAVLLGP